MKELQGTLKFKVLKQRAPKSGTGDEQDEEDVIISHFISPTFKVEYYDQMEKAECDGDMRDDNGKKIPFCDHEFNLDVANGKEDLKEKIYMTLDDRDGSVGCLGLKMQTLIKGGNPKSLEGLFKHKLIAQLEKEHTQWYPMFDGDTCPGSLQIQSKFIPDEKWKAKILEGGEKKSYVKCCLIGTGVTAVVAAAGGGAYAYFGS